MGKQTVSILGNVGAEPELRYTKDGTAVVSFSVAVNETWGKGENRRQRTTWFRASAWRGLAEVVSNHVHKGDQVLLEGTVQAGAYMDKNGQPAASLDLTVRDLTFANSGGNANDGASDNNASYEPPSDDDIPF